MAQTIHQATPTNGAKTTTAYIEQLREQSPDQRPALSSHLHADLSNLAATHGLDINGCLDQAIYGGTS